MVELHAARKQIQRRCIKTVEAAASSASPSPSQTNHVFWSAFNGEAPR
ncbi:MAG: hypothetical protein ACI4NI_04885 [Candidatus Ornithospirochaeta sp.]